MTSVKKQLRKNGYVLDEETGMYAVTPDFFRALLAGEVRSNGDGSNEPEAFSPPIGGLSEDDITGSVNEEEDVTGFLIRQLANCEALLEKYRARLGGVEQRLHQLEQRSMTHPGGFDPRPMAERNGFAGGVVRGLHDEPGNVGPVGDDEPFDSWAGRQIGKLSKIVNEEVLDRMARRISRVEERMTRFMMDDDSEFRVALRDIVDCAKAIDRVSEELAGTDRAVAEINDREVGNARAVNDWLLRIDARLSAYGVPDVRPESATITGAAAMREKAGLVALEAAAERLSKWMVPAFSAATVDAAVRVVKGFDVEQIGRRAE